MTQLFRKEVYIESSAEKELALFEKSVRKEFVSLILELRKYGTLKYPEGRKIVGYDLYEMRVKDDGIYRCMYSYLGQDIVILTAFRKKTQKTPLREIEKALKRKNRLI